MSSYILSACLLFVQMLATFISVEGTSLSIWKTQFLHFGRWEGHFMYNRKLHACKMRILSIDPDDDGGALVSFSADDNNLDMYAFSQDDIVIIFRTETIHHLEDNFFHDFQFIAEMRSVHNLHVLIGNITKPASNFSTVWLQPEGTRFTNQGSSSKLSVGLAIGISLTLFIICVVVGIVILRWAIRKGYLRHVARSYKSFRNQDSSVSFSNTQQENQTEEVNVHI